MSFSEEDILKLRIFCQEITRTPRPFNQQFVIKSVTSAGTKVYCDDWEVIEILKCLFLGEETYALDTPPIRLQGNPFWKVYEIVAQAKDYVRRFNTVDEIILALRERRAKEV